MRGLTHRVWVRVSEGVCGHCDAALRGGELGLFASPAASRGRLQSRGEGPHGQLLIWALALRRLHESALRQHRARCHAEGAATPSPESRADAIALAAATAVPGNRRNKGSKPETTSHGVQDATFLAGDSYVSAGVAVLARPRRSRCLRQGHLRGTVAQALRASLPRLCSSPAMFY